MMGGGRGMIMPTSTLPIAIVGIGNTSTNANNIVPKKNLFILLPPLSILDLTSCNRVVLVLFLLSQRRSSCL